MRLFVALVFLLGVLGCNSLPREDDAIAEVNGSPIRVEEFVALSETLKPKDLTLTPENRRQIRNLVLKTLIRRQVILSEAERKSLSISDRELEEGLKRFKEGYTSTAFEQSLLEQMLDEANWREKVRQTLLIEKLFDQSKPKIPTPAESDALEYYEKNRQQFSRRASAKALQIVVTDPKLAEEISQKLKRNPQDFVRLAREHSIGPEGQEENAVIQVEKDMMPEEIDRALFEGKINQISPVIHSVYGHHIFRVLSQTPALNLDFDQVKGQILQRLEAERRKEWLLRFEEQLIRSAEIRYNRELIQKL